MHEIYIIEWVIIVWSLVLIDLSTARVRRGATVQKVPKILVKTSGDTSDLSGFTRFFFRPRKFIFP